eukprot:4022289-Alexandrium_andersonii.AAC.1
MARAMGDKFCPQYWFRAFPRVALLAQAQATGPTSLPLAVRSGPVSCFLGRSSGCHLPWQMQPGS